MDRKIVSEEKRIAALNVGLGDPDKAVGSALYGLNALNTGVNAPNNTDIQGITFFTRPYLNLTNSNISVNRKLATLLTDTPHSIHYYIRRLLDVKLLANGPGIENFTPLLDHRQPFISIFTNLMTGITGWPDETLDTYISTPGLRNEVYMLADHGYKRYGAFDLTATFRNVDSDPINAILSVWLTYIKGVSVGELLPYVEMIANRIIDYQTRVYRLVLDSTRRWIRKIACCGAAMPIANPLGSSFNFNSESPTETESMNQSVPFKAVGYCYNDPIVIRDFNTTVSRFNFTMKDSRRKEIMLKIPPSLLSYLNYRCYPRISSEMELEWWVSKEIFNNTMNILDLSFTEEYCDDWFNN